MEQGKRVFTIPIYTTYTNIKNVTNGYYSHTSYQHILILILIFSVWEPFLCTYKYMYSIIIEYNWNLR